MGMEVVIDNAEDMCNLMCNNALPNNKKAQVENTKKNKDIVLDLERRIADLQSDVAELLNKKLDNDMLIKSMKDNMYFRLNEKNKKYVDEIIFALVVKQLDNKAKNKV